MSERITVHDYLSENPPARIIGTECEYNIQIPSSDEDDEDPIYLHYYISDEAIESAGLSHIGSFLSNGSRLYQDVGHLEYATPESLGPKQAAAADLAGIKVLRSIVTGSDIPHEGIYRIAGANIPSKNVFMPVGGHTNGYHENYLLPRGIAEDELAYKILPTFFASRVWAMGGAVQTHGYGLSQKINGMGGEPVDYYLNRRTQSGNKPMIMIPNSDYDSDVISDQDWARVELRYADPAHSPFVKYVGFAATSLVLRLIEHADKLHPKALESIVLDDPVDAARTYAFDITFKNTSQTVYDKSVTAIDVGEHFVKLARQLSKKIELPTEELAALRLWADILQRMRRSSFAKSEYAGLETLLDVAAKHRYIAGRTQDMRSTNPQAIKYAMAWDRIDPQGAAQIWWSKIPQPYVTDEDIAFLTHWAPPTRAAVRADMITNPGRKIDRIHWSGYHVKGRDAWTEIESDAYGNL